MGRGFSFDEAEMKYSEYKQDLLTALYALNYYLKTPSTSINGKLYIEAPQDEFWERASKANCITENIGTIAKDLEIMELEIRLRELKGE